MNSRNGVRPGLAAFVDASRHDVHVERGAERRAARTACLIRLCRVPRAFLQLAVRDRGRDKWDVVHSHNVGREVMSEIHSHNAFISYSHAADGKFAPALEQGLEKIAKPLLKLRALDIFRDESSLTASPGLWPG